MIGKHNITRERQTKGKSLYNFSCDGVRTRIVCEVNNNSGSIAIYTYIIKQEGWFGGSRNNPKCALYLGDIAEEVLSKVFANVERMQNGNKGFDFLCDKGYKIDVKSSCIGKHYNQWVFHIGKNDVADYFICMAFDNRESITPLYVWLIPGKILSHLISTSISVSTLSKWYRYELTGKLDEIVECCNTMKHC